MKGIHDLLKQFMKHGFTDSDLEILANSKQPLQVVVEQIKIATKHFEERGKMTKRHGRRPLAPRTIRGVEAPTSPSDQQVNNSLPVTTPDNPVIQTAPIEPPPVTLHASCVEKELAKFNGKDLAEAQPVEEKAPPTRVDLPRLRSRVRLSTPTSPVESSSDDSEQAAHTSDPPTTVDPIAPVLGALAGKTGQRISQKKQKRQAVEDNIRKSVVAK